MEPEYKRTEDDMARFISSFRYPGAPTTPEWDPDAPENNMTSEEIEAKWDEEYRQKWEKIMGGPPPKQETD